MKNLNVCSVHFFFLIILLVSCVKDKPIVQNEPSIFFSGDRRKVFILNEGNFGSGNGSVSLYDPITGGITEDFFYQQNQFQAGDVVQSLTFFQGMYYLVVNNSGKIYAMDKQFKVQKTLSGLTSPRYLLPLSSNRALVSDLYSNALYVVDLNAMQVQQQIPFHGWAERMLKINEKVFITNMKKNYVFVLHADSLKITDSIPVHRGSSSLLLDRYYKLWILCSGDVMQSMPGALYRVNPQTLQVEWSASFTSGYPSHLCSNPTADTLYFLQSQGIARMPVLSSNLPQGAWIPLGNRNFYALNANPESGNLYVSDAKDYLQKSDILIYRPDGTSLGSFKAGIISGNFYFD